MAFDHLQVAIIHHWLAARRGGERVLEALCRLFPHADIFTLVCNPEVLSASVKDHRITTSWIQKLPGAVHHYPYYVPLFPLAVEDFDLSGYDLVVSSDAAICKGVLTRPETCHVCYCHSPMRYAWNAYPVYRDSIDGSLTRLIFSLSMHYLRLWDHAAASRVDYFVANSRSVAARIQKYYRRRATVIYPPVEVSGFGICNDIQDYYLAAGQLVPYKRFDLAIEAFNQLQRPLWIAGDGPEYRRLKRTARGNVRFLGRTSDEDWTKLLSQCRALIFPGEEDFGMVVVEANACGRPVIALARGGVAEIVDPEINGLLFTDESVPSLIDAVRKFETIEQRFVPVRIREMIAGFGEERFRGEFISYLEETLQDFNASRQRGGTK
jgi:glycosyltransferase involved in cell wall biosynthesis